MKTDLNLSQLVSQLDYLSTLKKDYLISTDDISVQTNPAESCINFQGVSYPMQETAKRQLSAVCGIPYSYVKRIGKEYPELLDANYNGLLRNIHKNKLMRTIGGRVRAILSDHYKKYENEAVLATILSVLDNIKGLNVVSSSLTAERMYVKMVSEIERVDVKVGDSVAFGAIITNSEVGMGSITVNPFCMRLVCTNGMALPKYLGNARRIHLGRKFRTIEEYEMIADDIDGIRGNIEECLKEALDPVFYMKIVDKMRMATEIKLVAPFESIDKVAKLYGLDEREKKTITVHYIAGKDETLYGLVNAVTRASQDMQSYVRATEMEKIGSDILFDGILSVTKKGSGMLMDSVLK